MGLLKFIHSLASEIQGTFGALLMIICIGAILLLAVITILRIPTKTLAVTLQAIGTAILMMPIMWGFNNFVDSQVENKAQAAENARLVQEQNNNIHDLENSIRQLENSGFNLQAFNKILEVALIQTELQQTVMTNNVFDTSHRGLGFGGNYDWQYLGVLTNDIIVKFGVDLNKIKVYRSSAAPGTINVVGVSSKFIGVTKNNPHVELSEVRKLILDFDSNPKTDGVEIDYSTEAARQKQIQERQWLEKYQQRLSQGIETTFMNDTVEKLGENFIQMILAPLNQRVVFTDDINASSVPLADFINQEKEKRTQELTRLKDGAASSRD
jgi:hypothetical protein